LRLIEAYEPPDPPSVDVPPRQATGFGSAEAPRELIYHRYRIAADGTIKDAKAHPSHVAEPARHRSRSPRLDLAHERLTWECEQAVRNYDPCISCSTHFLDLRVLQK